MFLVGLGIYLVGTCLLIGLPGGHVLNFIDVPSLLMVVAPSLAVLTATRSFKVFWGGLRAAILPKEPLVEELRGQAASLFRLLSKATAIAAGAGALLCAANALLHMTFLTSDDVNIFGHSIGSALMISLYALILIGALFEPAVFCLKKRR